MPSHKLIGASARALGRSGSNANLICSSCLLLLRRATPRFATTPPRRHATDFSTRASTTPKTYSRQISYVHNRSLAETIRQTRFQSTSPTPRPAISINAPSPIPPAARALHAALLDLERSAINFVPLSRLKLALRSLEKGPEETVTRVAILGLGTHDGARRLTKCLLADVLSAKQDWEKILEDGSDKRAILLRYGEDGEMRTSNSAFRELFVPSPLLRKHNLELMVSSIQVDTRQTGPANGIHERSVLDSLLSPTLFAPASAAGGYSSVTHPVHQTLLVGDGLKDLLALGKFIASAGGQNLPTELVKLAVLDNSSLSRGAPDEQDVTVVNIWEAEEAVSTFRKSVQNAAAYEHDWFGSHISALTGWLSPEVKSTSQLKKPLTAFIENILLDVSKRIEASAVVLQSTQPAVSESVRNSLNKAITEWAEHAHAELRDSLAISFQSNWNKLKWWKLFWRVDDVAMISSESIENKWLVNAERELIFITGRMNEAALLNHSTFLQPHPYSNVVLDGQTTIPTHQPIISKTEQSKEETFSLPAVSIPPPPAIPYPQQLPLYRSTFLSVDVPSLQSKAQNLVFQCLSTTALTTSLSVLLYLSTPVAGIYEAGSIGALGFVYALSRLQSKWETARTTFQIRLREDGRRVLLSTEDEIRAAVRTSDRTELDEVMVQGIEQARTALERTREAISGIGDK